MTWSQGSSFTTDGQGKLILVLCQKPHGSA